MDQHLTAEQILALAPDTASAKAARPLSAARAWLQVARNGSTLWGECQGSAKDPYRTQIDLSEPAFRCSCPSRKFPCKHGLGLLLLYAEQPGRFDEQPPPVWVSEWLATRSERATRRTERQEKAKGDEDDGAAQQRRAAARESRVATGLAELDRWLYDQVRAGLADLQSRAPGAFDTMAARMVDAQVPGVARMLRDAGSIAVSGDGWQALLLDRLARIHLLTQAYRRLAELAPENQADVRVSLGFTQTQEEVLAGGIIRDRWIVVGQIVEEEGHLTIQRSWLWGLQSSRPALVLAFSAAGQPLDRSLLVGALLEADLAFYPSAAPLRAVVGARYAAGEQAANAALPFASLNEGLRGYATALASNPWTERMLLLIDATRLARDSERWYVCDALGRSLPLSQRIGDPWRWLALCANRPTPLVAEWNGRSLIPLSLLLDQQILPLR
jgi:hypothetical protein